MMELTTLDGLPIFVAVDSIEFVEQQEDGTLICTKSGHFKFVSENAAEVYFEVKKFQEEQLMLKIAGLQQ